jgi:hypothetical protein
MNESMLNATSRLLCGAIAAALILFAVHAEAAVVSGIYTNPAGKPLPDHQLHFENRISGDMYLTRTGDDGSFASDLPPGTYDLRAERGLVVRPGIRVDGPEALNVGRVSDGAPFDVRRPFEREGILSPLLDTEAPATAHLAGAAGAPSGAPSATQNAASIPNVAPSQTH